MIEDGTLDATDIAKELTMYAVRDLRLEPNEDCSSLDGKICMRNWKVQIA